MLTIEIRKMPRGRVEFRDVAFGYEELHTRTLRGVTFSVQAGQMIAIVGRSGAGKTTLVNLLPRFYDVGAGSILIDGVELIASLLHPGVVPAPDGAAAIAVHAHA